MLPRLFAAALLACFAVASLAAPQARANGVPQLVKLTYLQGVSDFGPHDAEGVLEFSFAEAYARVEVKNLPPVAGFTYEGWLMGGEGEPFFVGKIPVQPSGVATVEQKLDGLARYDYNLFVIAARPDGAAPGVVPAQRSIAGRFAVIADPKDGSTAGDIRPAQLPETGQPEPASGPRWAVIFRNTTVALGAALAVFGIIRTVRRRAQR